MSQTKAQLIGGVGISTVESLIVGVGTSSISIDGNTGSITIGTGVTITDTGIIGSASTVVSASTAYGLSGSPDITVGTITGVQASFTGNVSIAGTLTYDDVTNVDSIGLVTARSGVNIGPLASIGSTLSSDGSASFSGIVTASSFKGSGTNLTSLNASNLSTGTVATARLASGTANSATFLRGDQTWSPVGSMPTVYVYTSPATWTKPSTILCSTLGSRKFLNSVCISPKEER